jgi:hypothetical protein
MCLVQGTLQSTGKRSSLPHLGVSQACLFERDYKHTTVLDVEVRDHTPAKLDVGLRLRLDHDTPSQISSSHADSLGWLLGSKCSSRLRKLVGPRTRKSYA